MKNPNAVNIAHYANTDCGFKDTFTGRLICPQAWVEEYDKDPTMYVMTHCHSDIHKV